MKKAFLIIILLIGSLCINAQVYKFKTLASWSSYKDANNNWTKLEKSKNGSSILVVVDTKGEKVSIYTGKEMHLHIINTEYGDTKEGSFIKYTCIDGDNLKCTVTTTSKKDEPEVFMTLLWDGTKVIYMLGEP